MWFSLPAASFNIQLGREVMAGLLQLDKRADWRDCIQPMEEETNEAEKLKADFADFDFAM